MGRKNKWTYELEERLEELVDMQTYTMTEIAVLLGFVDEHGRGIKGAVSKKMQLMDLRLDRSPEQIRQQNRLSGRKGGRMRMKNLYAQYGLKYRPGACLLSKMNRENRGVHTN